MYQKLTCFRLLTEYHSFLSLVLLSITLNTIYSFRLLTEYHSFLYGVYKALFSYNTVSVSLRSIIHSYVNINGKQVANAEFPSPYGVSFILINISKRMVNMR